MFQDIIVPFIAVGLAELGDKTQLAIFCLSSKTKKHLHLLAGVILAFIIADGLAILLGDFITGVVPEGYLKMFAGALFIVFGAIALISRKEEESKCDLKSPFMSGFVIILLSEMGDKTQLASGLFATQYDPLMVFAGVILALALLSFLAVSMGKIIITRVDKKVISVVAGLLFLAIGISFFL